MGILRSLFGNNNSVPAEKVSTMLDENLFWNIVDRSLSGGPDQEEQEKKLIREILKLTPEEMIGFRLRTDQLLYDTYNSATWCAGYIINEGCSDDGFEYFRCWIISKGKDVYYAAKANPDSLVNFTNEDVDIYEFESFWYVALEAFKTRTGKDLYDYIDYDRFKKHEGEYPEIDLEWQEEDPKSMSKFCPRLFAKKA